MSKQQKSVNNPTDRSRSSISGRGERPRTKKSQRDRRRSTIYDLPKDNIEAPELEEPILVTPWEAFQEHLRLIDDNTAMYSLRDPANENEKDKPAKDNGDGEEEIRPPEPTLEQKAAELAKQLKSAINVKNSEAFSKTMHEFQLRKQQHLEKLAAIQRERERRAQEEQDAGKEQDEETLKEEVEEAFDSDWSEDDGEEVIDDVTLHLRQTAARAWGIVRRHIQEISMEKKQKSSAMNWSFLRQTLANMTDMEKGRRNLYERYLYNPETWKDGFTNFPTELFNREKGRGRRMYVPPASAKPKIRRNNNKRPTKAKSTENMVALKSH